MANKLVSIDISCTFAFVLSLVFGGFFILIAKIPQPQKQNNENSGKLQKFLLLYVPSF